MHKKITFFKKKEIIYPKRVWGKYRKIKWLVMIFTLAIYYFAPWLRWDRGEHVPDQAILIDLPSRKAYFFFIEIWPQEVYYLTGILILSAVALFFVTSLLGRVWCGYACPQTVWTDLFVWVERIIQGDRNTRMKLSNGPWTFEKIWKKTLTHIIWLIIGLMTGGAWVFYFNDAPSLFQDILNFDVSEAVAIWVIGLTFSTYLMAGFAREQVCTYMCPYARFQSAMFDKDTLIVSYDAQRGEPRGAHKAGDNWEGKGHCIDCQQCVVVCPQGIDIRNGLQMECIACGLCVDACNNIMDKVGLPRGLIKYDTARNIHARLHQLKEKFRIIRPRTIYYTIIMSIIGGLMVYGLATRSELELNIIHDRNPLFTQLSDGTIRNGYTIHILNKSHDDKNYELTIKGLEYNDIRIVSAQELYPDNLPAFADSVAQYRVFISAVKPEKPRKNFEMVLIDKKTNIKDTVKTVFMSGE